MTPLEEVLKPEAFEKGIIKKIEEGVYKWEAGVTLAETATLSELGYVTLIVTDKCITIAEHFFPPEAEKIRKGEQKLKEIYFVTPSKVERIATELSKKKNLPFSSTLKWWLQGI